nr:hypothetical protein CPGR_04136 [Mycolicibacter nonchromogenicus]
MIMNTTIDRVTAVMKKSCMKPSTSQWPTSGMAKCGLNI